MSVARNTSGFLVFGRFAFSTHLAICIALRAFGGETIPPTDLTSTAITTTRVRLAEYYSTHHRLPNSLAELPAPAGNRCGSTKDGWGRDLLYTVDSRGVVTLRSWVQTVAEKVPNITQTWPSHFNSMRD